MKWAVLVALAACSTPSRSGMGDDTVTPDAPHGSDAVVGPDAPDNCSEAAKKVYVLDTNTTISVFTPPATFADLGAPSCSTSAQPASMGVDRNALAWVLYTDGTLYNVDLTQTPLVCTPTNWVRGTSGEMDFGMGFSTDSVGGTTDTLFIAGGASFSPGEPSQLASLDLTASPITAATLGTPLPGHPELTGNALAELWGFFPSPDGVAATKVGRIDKDTAALDPLYTFPTLTNNAGYAFAFYGGTYYMFVGNPANLNHTVIYAMDANGNLASTAGTQTTRSIVGAGVSTCAPVVIGR